MAQLLRRLLQVPNMLLKGKAPTRNIATSRCVAENYKGDGRTTVTILNREYRHLIMVDSLSNYGFRLNNNIFVIGPMAVFPRTILQWNVNDVESITLESLGLFSLLVPKLDIFVLGTGDKKVQPKREILEFFKEKRISTEILNTEKACSIFNFLNVEGRCVAGAFIPPSKVNVYEDDIQMIGSSDRMGDTGYIV